MQKGKIERAKKGGLSQKDCRMTERRRLPRSLTVAHNDEKEKIKKPSGWRA